MRSSLKANPSPQLPNQWVFYLIAALGIIISIALWYAFVMQANNNLQHIVNIQSKHIANDINVQLELRISALKHLAKHLNTTNSAQHSGWKAETHDLIENFSGVEAIAWFDPSQKQLLWLAQTQYNRFGVVKYSELTRKHLPELKPTFVRFSKPFALNDSDKAFLVYVQTENGMLVSLLNLDIILDSGINNNDYSVSISDDGKEFYRYGNDLDVIHDNIVTVPISIYGCDWLISLRPSTELIRAVETHLPFIALMLGIFIAILFAITSRLAHLAKQRANSVEMINNDLTNEIIERKLAEASKRKLEKAMLEGQKLQAIGTLAGGIAHDFNNILYAMIGYVEMAREDVVKVPLVHENLGKVLQAATRGQELISRILTFSRRQAFEFKIVSMQETMEEVLSLLKSTIPASINLVFNSTVVDKSLISGNQTHLHQVVMNIVNNAVDAMHGEGDITLTLDKINASNPILQQLPNALNADYYRLDIKDNGCGMDTSVLERIFEPFFTTKEVGKGTGLGLATAHAIIREHKGDILVNSEMAVGTTFSIFIPAHGGEPHNGKDTLS